MREHFELVSAKVGALPIVNHFLARLGLIGALDRHVPDDDDRLALSPATVLSLVISNLVVDHEPVYALLEWARAYDPGLLGLEAGEVGLLNDDRVGRMLERLFDADRASLLTEVMVGAIKRFKIDCSQLHNDSSTVTFVGAHKGADGRRRGGKETAAICFGYNKDHRPDLKQLVLILTVSADGALPIAHRVVDGNTEDSTTHIESWDDLVGLVGRTDFLYVGDSKLATARRWTTSRRAAVLCHRLAAHETGGRLVPGLGDPQHPDLDRGDAPPRPAQGGPRRRLLHLRAAARVLRGLPHHLGPLDPQARERRRHPTTAHRAGDGRFEKR